MFFLKKKKRVGLHDGFHTLKMLKYLYFFVLVLTICEDTRFMNLKDLGLVILLHRIGPNNF